MQHSTPPLLSEEPNLQDEFLSNSLDPGNSHDLFQCFDDVAVYLHDATVQTHNGWYDHVTELCAVYVGKV